MGKLWPLHLISKTGASKTPSIYPIGLLKLSTPSTGVSTHFGALTPSMRLRS